MNGSIQEQIQELQEILAKAMQLQLELTKKASEHLVQTQAWRFVLAIITVHHYRSLSEPIQTAKQDGARISEGLRKRGDEELASEVEKVYKAIVERLETPDDPFLFPDFDESPTIH